MLQLKLQKLFSLKFTLTLVFGVLLFYSEVGFVSQVFLKEVSINELADGASNIHVVEKDSEGNTPSQLAHKLEYSEIIELFKK